MAFRSSPAFRATAIAAMLLVLAVILYESSQARGQPGIPDLTANEAYAGHFAIYAAMTLSALVAIGRRSLVIVLLVTELAIGLGVAMELYQINVPGRTASLGDVIANSSGAVIGAMAFVVLVKVFDALEAQPTRS